MFDINSIDISTFISYKRNVFIRKGFSENSKIFKYITKYEYFEDLLKSDTLYINKRNSFSDRRERGELYNKKFHFYRFSVANEKVSERVLEEWTYKDKQIKEACKLHTSCWTKKKEEDFLMWKAYSGRDGVRIETTIGKLVNSLSDVLNNTLFCGDMEYGKEKPFYEVVDSMFYKTPYYKNEEEFRVYIIEEKESADSIRLEISPIHMIEKVILSPFLPIDDAKSKIKALQEKYNFLENKVSISEIIEERGE